MRFLLFLTLLCNSIRAEETHPGGFVDFLDQHCYSCHDSASGKGDFDLESLPFKLSDGDNATRWELIYDRVRDGEMPPKKKSQPEPAERSAFLEALAAPLIAADKKAIAANGRSPIRRLNRFEYENTLREVLDAPWLIVADRLPEDGVAHLFNKSSAQLDVSHVQMTAYLETIHHALRIAIQAAAHPTTTNRFYARDEDGMASNLRYRFGQMAATRATIPLLGTTPQPDVIRGKQPVTVGDSDPATREREAFGFVSGTYTATTKYDFRRMKVPTDGNYRIRMKSYSFLAGPNGASGGKDHGLTGGQRKWWQPSRTEAFPGTRSEPITLYALADSGDSRWLTTYDATPEPAVIERVVTLKAEEDIRPDAGRLVRTRPGFNGNPNATKDGVPGFALNWLEVEGPLHESWPPPSYQAVLGDLPFEVDDSGQVKALPENSEQAARSRLHALMQRAYRREIAASEVTPFLELYRQAIDLGNDFTEALISASSAVLCSPQFLYLHPESDPLVGCDLAARLSYFLWNGPPDQQLLNGSDPLAQTDRLLDDPRSEQFTNAFLDYWLELREINTDAPDAELYPDYYLDDLLTESSLRETRLFFRHLVKNDLPARTLIDADFAFVNERLADHYGLASFEGVEPRLVSLPPDSPRGGLLTQASVLRVTANGTTTSPVLRGAWIMERLLGVPIPPPPSGVAAVEPDTRGSTTIREQLALHRTAQSCNSCHAKFDPAGFALESFDVAGGWRDRYRAIGNGGTPPEGYGLNGHRFTFHYGQAVDPSGELNPAETFGDIQGLKQLLLRDDRPIARNLLQQLIVFATGAPVSFSERAEVERILDACSDRDYGVRSLIHALVRSPLFAKK